LQIIISSGGTLEEAVSSLQFVSSKQRSLDVVHGFNGKGNDMFVSLESCKKLPAHLYLINQCHSDKKVKTAYKRIQTRSMERGRANFGSVGWS